MALPAGFIGTIEDDEEVENDEIDSDEDEVSVRVCKPLIPTSPPSHRP